MQRTVAILAVAAVLVAGCAEAFEPPGGAAGTPGSSTTHRETPTPSPTSTPTPPPVVRALADLPREGDDPEHVRVLGWLRTGGSVFCRGDSCSLELVDPSDPTDHVTLRVERDGSSPNTMASIGSSFSEADLAVIAADGSTLRSGDHAWLTGWWTPDGDTLTAEIVERATTPKFASAASTFAQLRTRKPGTLVRVSGRLEAPVILSCGGTNGTCNLYLGDLNGRSPSVRIEVRIGGVGASRPNTMRPMKDGFRDADLRVFDAKKTPCRAGDHVTVVGWLYRDDDGKAYLEPVQAITRVGS